MKTAEQWLNEARAFINAQEFDSALACLNESIAVTPNADAYHDSGVIHYMAGRLPAAVESLQTALALDPADARAAANLARILYENGQRQPAIEYSCRAMKAAPDNSVYRHDFTRIISNLSLSIFYPAIKDALLTCLQADDITHELITFPWLSTLKHDPALRPLTDLLKVTDYKNFSKKLSRTADVSAFGDPYFLAGLRRLVIPDQDTELFLTHLRRFLLDKTAAGEPLPFSDKTMDIACALALHCFYNDYIFATDPAEESALPLLHTRAAAGDPLSLALIACYEPLFLRYKNVTYSPLPENLAQLIHIMIANPATEQDIRDTIPVMTPIDDNISRAVRTQYEEFPYPRWSTIDSSVRYDGLRTLPAGARILNAGCGTGMQSVQCQMTFPQAELTAVDLSLASLAYAKRQATQMGLPAIKFAQADILQLESCGETFDVIISSGVLHHIADPEKGWHILRNILKPGGMMLLGLYSEIGRQSVVAAHEVIARKKIPNDRNGIKYFRKNIVKLIGRRDAHHLLQSKDFYTMPECRDLLFHVQEQRFTLERIAQALKTMDMEFTGFEISPVLRQQYNKAYPQDPHGLSLDNWAAFERAHPDTFSGMYNFWCRRL
ncbi:MAG: methyltransferase domain-containing protein [Alphaproteobacteria bacterium]|nr:methyltransferase domain-containing protein [Alphaproteobacteria bacterium]